MLVQTLPDVHGFLRLMRVNCLPANGISELEFEVAPDMARSAGMAALARRHREVNWWRMYILRVNGDRTAREGAIVTECNVRIAGVGYDEKCLPAGLRMEFGIVAVPEAMNLMAGPPSERWFHVDMRPLERSEIEMSLQNKLMADPMNSGSAGETEEEAF